MEEAESDLFAGVMYFFQALYGDTPTPLGADCKIRKLLPAGATIDSHSAFLLSSQLQETGGSAAGSILPAAPSVGRASH